MDKRIVVLIILVLNLSCMTSIATDNIRAYHRNHSQVEEIKEKVKTNKNFKNLIDKQIHVGEYRGIGIPKNGRDNYHLAKFKKIINNWESDLLIYASDNYPIEWQPVSWSEEPKSPPAFLFIRNLNIAKSINPNNYLEYVKTSNPIELPLIVLNITPIDDLKAEVYYKMFSSDGKLIENTTIKDSYFTIEEDKITTKKISSGFGANLVSGLLHAQYIISIPLDVALGPFYLAFFLLADFGKIR